jgi:lipopolysaccharide assembly protein B
MEFDLGWILLGLPLAFALGWFASRMDLRQLRLENRQVPKAYFKGLNFLLNEQQDKAIDAFIEAVQNDPDTSELHFALGNLFRRRGEYDRAVRVHEHLLSRGDLGQADRARAQHALALDFLKAGLLDRAEDALRRLDGTSYQDAAGLALLAIYERSRDWPRAAGVAHRLTEAGTADFSGRQAHYLCEQASALAAQGQPDAAREALERAIAQAPQSARPRIELAQWFETAGQPGKAYDTLVDLARETPEALPLVAERMMGVASICHRGAQARELLRTHYARYASLDLLEAMVRDLSPDDRRAAYATHLDREPSLIVATRWLASERFEHEEAHASVQRALEQATRPLSRYRCAACGFEASRHFWQCPGCQAWDSYPPNRVEEL